MNKNKKFIDINSHEFTLDVLETHEKLLIKQAKAIRKLARKNFNKTIAIGLLAVGVYYIFDNLNQRVKALENKQKESEDSSEPEE